MVTRPLVYYALSTLSGLLWGLFVWRVIFGGVPSALMGGVIASPVIGLGIGIATRPWYRLRLWLRILVSLVSLYVGAALFGAAVGVYDWLVIHLPNQIPHAVVLENILAYLWGLTFSGFLIGLWPAAYLNHWLLGKFMASRDASQSDDAANGALPSEGEG